MSVLHSRMPLATVPISRLQNGQTGYSDVLAVPAANAATLADHIDGLGTYGMPINPSGEYGHDHSGGLFGRPMFVSVASTTLNPDVFVTGVRQPAKFYFLSTESAAGGITTAVDGQPVPIWVPGCDPIAGAYVRLAIRFTARLASTTLTSSDTVEVIAKINDDSYTFTLTNPHITGVRNFASASTTQLIGTVPGAINNVSFRTRVVRVAGGSSRGCVIYFQEMELGVYQT